jgi:hypothetical protein
LKEKIMKMSKPAKDDEEEETKTSEESPFIWDLQIVNEAKTLTSLVD